MEARPPALIEAIVGCLIPPACREYVLGDLSERYTSPTGYLVEAMRTIPLVIVGRVRRTWDALLVIGEAQILLLTFYGAAFAAAGSAVKIGWTAASQWSVVPRGSITPTPLWTALMAVVLAGIFRRGVARLQEEIDAIDSRP